MKKKLLKVGLVLALLAAANAEEVKAAGDYWSSNGAATTYIKNGSTVKNTWELIGYNWYHFDNQGNMQTGWHEISGSWYYFNADGSCAANRWQDGCYLNASGRAVQSGWIQHKNDWYYVTNGGYATNTWIGEYYFRGDGRMARNTWVNNYYVGSTGACVYNAFVGDWYVGGNGKAVFGQWVMSGGNWYYIGRNGKYVRNNTYVEGTTEYTFGNQGTITSTKSVSRTSTIGGLTSPIVASDRTTYPNDNILWEYTPIPNYYAAERVSPVGKIVYKLRVGDTLTIDGKNYRVNERKTGLTFNDVDSFVAYLNSSHYDLGLQTCDNVNTYIIIYKLILI